MFSKTRYFDYPGEIKIERKFERKQKSMKVRKHCQVK